MKLYIGADHRGADLAEQIFRKLKLLGKDVEKSSLINNENDDYPDFAFDVCQHVIENKDNLGIVICGNGIGVSIAANKVKGIRCARVLTPEDAHHAKNHNGANVIALGDLSVEDAMDITSTFMETQYPIEERHLRRIGKIIKFENGEYNEL